MKPSWETPYLTHTRGKLIYKGSAYNPWIYCITLCPMGKKANIDVPCMTPQHSTPQRSNYLFSLNQTHRQQPQLSSKFCRKLRYWSTLSHLAFPNFPPILWDFGGAWRFLSSSGHNNPSMLPSPHITAMHRAQTPPRCFSPFLPSPGLQRWYISRYTSGDQKEEKEKQPTVYAL